MSQKQVSWNFAFGLVTGPIIVYLLLVPSAVDLFFPGLGVGGKTTVLILGVVTLLWSMLQSVRQANYILEWSIIIALLAIFFEVEKYVPRDTLTTTQITQQQVPVVPTLAPQSSPLPVARKGKVIVDKSKDTLQFTTFDAKEGTPVPTPTPTPNLTPLFDFSSFTAKDQSIGKLPDSAFFGGKKSAGGGSITRWMQQIWSYLLGR